MGRATAMASNVSSVAASSTAASDIVAVPSRDVVALDDRDRELINLRKK